MGVRGSRKGYGNPKRISFLLGFSFPLRLEPYGGWQLNVMAICAQAFFTRWKVNMKSLMKTVTLNTIVIKPLDSGPALQLHRLHWLKAGPGYIAVLIVTNKYLERTLLLLNSIYGRGLKHAARDAFWYF